MDSCHEKELLLNWEDHSIPNSGQILSLSFPWTHSKFTKATHTHFVLIWKYCVHCFSKSACWWRPIDTTETFLMMAFSLAVTFTCCCKLFSWARTFPVWLNKVKKLNMFTPFPSQSETFSTMSSLSLMVMRSDGSNEFSLPDLGEATNDHQVPLKGSGCHQTWTFISPALTWMKKRHSRESRSQLEEGVSEDDYSKGAQRNILMKKLWKWELDKILSTFGSALGLVVLMLLFFYQHLRVQD